MARREEERDYESMKDRLSELRGKIADLESSVESQIEEHPLRSVALAFGIGVLTGAIIAMLRKR